MFRTNSSIGFCGIAFALVILATALSGCLSIPTPSPTSTPPPPVVTLVVNPRITDILAGKTVAISAETGGQSLRFKWSAVRGKLTAFDTPAVIYTAPDTPGVDTVTVEVSSASGTTIENVSFNVATSITLTPTPTPTATSTPTPTMTPTPVPTATVRLDALAAPAYWMSGDMGHPEKYIQVADCTGRAADSGCKQWTYRTGGQWAGVLWWPPACGGSGTPDALARVQRGDCAINVFELGGFSTVRYLTFWARGMTGNEKIELKVGSAPGGIPPTPSRSLGTVTLKSTWQRYEVNLRDIDLTNAIALFYWGATDQNNPNGAVFYLDDIQFEGDKK